MSEEINAKGYFVPTVAHPENCTGCRYCLLVCPDVAIQVENKGKVTEPPESLTGKPFSYCPGCTHGVIHRLVGRGHRRAGHPRAHGRHRAGRVLGAGLRVLQLRHAGGLARARDGAWPPASSAARPDLIGVHLPGRRRPRLDRHGRDGARGQPRREDHRDLRQQRDLRHDRRPDGADHAAGPGRHDVPDRARRQRWPATRSASWSCCNRCGRRRTWRA